MTEILFKLNTASTAQIVEHLRRCDEQFVPVLSSRVDIDDYGRKIAAKAERFEAWAEESLVGLVAAYCNDTARRIAFVTSVSVLQNWTGMGIGVEMLRHCASHASTHGMSALALEVSEQNRAAIRLYEQCGFATIDRGGSNLTMHLALTEVSNERTP